MSKRKARHNEQPAGQPVHGWCNCQHSEDRHRQDGERTCKVNGCLCAGFKVMVPR